MGIGKLLGLEEDPKINALVGGNNKLIEMLHSVFAGYQANVKAVLSEYERLNEENEKIKRFLKEKFPDD